MINKEKIYKHYTFLIGETLVDVDKRHISAEDACEKIRKHLQQLDAKLSENKDKSCLRCIHYKSINGYCYKLDTYNTSNVTCKFWEGIGGKGE